MNLVNEMKYFSAVAVDGSTYNFGITPKGEISCAEFGLNIPASIIELKPNFVLRNSDGSTLYSLDDYLRNMNTKKSEGLSLINEWIIPDDVFKYLVDNKKLMYSTNMAILYGFDKTYAFDSRHNKRAFKHTKNNEKKRAKILSPMKLGNFN